jgi:steroid 5-alpha reductase family enzyme
VPAADAVALCYRGRGWRAMEDRRYARFERRRKSETIFSRIIFAVILVLVFLLMFKLVLGF